MDSELNMTNKVVLDTSVLLIPGRSKGRDIFLELLKLLGNYEAIIPQYVLDELKAVQNNKKKSKKVRDAAKLGLSLVEKMVLEKELQTAARTGLEKSVVPGFVYDLQVEGAHKSMKTVDDSLIDFSKKLGARLCTSDTGLRKKAEKAGLNVLFIGPLKYPKRSRTKN